MEYQNEVKKIVTELGIDSDLKSRLLDLTSEVGELSKELLSSTNYGKKDFKITENWELELGDVFFSLCCLANQTNTNLENALTKAIQKYKQRFDEKGQISSA